VPLVEARRQFEVNVFGLARLVQLVLPHMRAAGSGRIVNVSSMGGKIYGPLGAWYHASKFAVEGLSDSLRLELAPFGVDVVLIEPGLIRTEWGVIAAEKVEQTSGSTAYAEQARRVAAVIRPAAESRATDPRVIGRLIAEAATARRPRTRYAAGYGAKPLLLARRLLPDRAFDRVVGNVYRERR
jgi:NAD(P)-dependent dehydrogenase (short-subunit alcohol dehydrogenase family)